MERIYHYAISLHTESPPNTNLVKAHEKDAVYIGADFKPTIHENHLMVQTAALAEKVAAKLLPSLAEKYGATTSMRVVYESALATEKQIGRFAEHGPLIQEFIS